MYLLFIVIVIILVASDWFVCRGSVRLARRLAVRGQRKEAVRLLEQCLAVPTGGQKHLVRYQLGVLYFQERRSEEAAEQFKTLLNQKLPAGLEADIRRRLGDCLDNAGQFSQGEGQRQKASDAVQKGQDVLSLSTRGDLLKRENRFDDACLVYEQALRAVLEHKSALRAELMVKLALASFDGGKLDQSIKWAEVALQSKPQGAYLRLAHTTAGVAYGSQGDFDQAEKHTHSAYDISMQAGDTTQAGRSIGLLASYQKRHGKVREALQTVEASFADGLVSRTGYLVRGECFQALGQFAEARDALLRAGEITESGASIVQHERRQQGVICLGIARIFVQEENSAAAWEQIQKALVVFADDAKLNLWCQLVVAEIFALQGQTEKAWERIHWAEHQMPAFSTDKNSQTTCLGSLGRATFSLKDYAASESYWRHYLAAKPDRVWLPRMYYYLGECLRHRGDLAGAQEMFEAGLGLNLETFESTRTKEALTKMLTAF